MSVTDLFRYTEERMRKETSQVPMRWDLNVQGSELIIARTGGTWRERQHDIIKQRLIGLEADRWADAVNAYRQVHEGLISSREQDVLIGEVTTKLMREKIAGLDFQSREALGREDWSEAVNKLQLWLALEPTHSEARERLDLAKRRIQESKLAANRIPHGYQILNRLESVLSSRYGRYILFAAILSGLATLIVVFIFKVLFGWLLVYGMLSVVLGVVRPNDPWKLGLWLTSPLLLLFGLSIGLGVFFPGYFLVLISQDIPLVATGLMLSYSGAHLGARLSSLRKINRGSNRFGFGTPTSYKT